MTIPSCLPRMLSGAAVAAMFVAAPFAMKFDASGMIVVPAVAFALTVPDIMEPPIGPIEPPTGCDINCGPPDGPIDPPACDVDCGPPIDPIDPNECEVDCLPPVDPIDCEQTIQGCKPEPVSLPVPTGSDNDDDNLPPVVEEDDITQDQGMEFAKDLRCKTECKATVAADGDVTVTLASNGPGDTKIITSVSLEGTLVVLTLDMPGSDTLDVNFPEMGTRAEAQELTMVVVMAVPATVDFAGGDNTTQFLRSIGQSIGSNTQATQAVSDAALGTVESHFESNFEVDSSSNS